MRLLITLAQLSRSWGWLGLLLLLSACATAPDSGAPVEERRTPTSSKPKTPWPPLPADSDSSGVLVRPLPTPKSEGMDSDNPAVKHLLYRAERQARSGHYGLSAASLERALEIAPGDAWLWHRLARIRLAEGSPEQARLLARKSVVLAGSNPRLLAANQKLLQLIATKTGARP